MPSDTNSGAMSRRDFFSLLQPPEVESDPEPSDPDKGIASSRIVQRLKELGVTVIPLSEEDHRLEVQCSGADDFSDDHARLLQPLAQDIVRLDLGDTDIGDDGLRVVAHMNQLARLHLERTGITDDGLKHVGQVDTLTYLNLFDTEVSDRGVEHLSNLDRLEQLFLGQTEVTEEGVENLEDRLPEANVQSGFRFQTD